MLRIGSKFSLALLGLLLFLLLLAACGEQSTFEAKGEVARKQLDLFWIIFGLGVFVFVVVEGTLIYAAIRFQRRPGQGIPKQIHGHPKLEIAWTIAPALVLVGIAIPTLIVIFETSSTGGPDFTRRVVETVADPEKEISLADARLIRASAAPGELIDIPRIKVHIRAHQWWWEFRYSDFNIETANELHVPVHTRIDLTLESDDVIHSFWVPNLMGKLDVIPRNVNQTWFVADEPGIYKGQCAEFCGVAHADMRLRVIVHDQAGFEKWKADYGATPAEPTGEAVLGKELFTGRGGCSLCHRLDGPTSLAERKSQRDAFLRGDPVFPGPNLTLFATRTTMAAGLIPLTEANLEAWLRNPDEVKSGNRMAEKAAIYNNPALSLTPEEVSALVAYLLSLHPPVAVISTPTPVPPPGATPTPTAAPTPTVTPAPTPTPVALPPGNPDRGADVFKTASPIPCATCHSTDGIDGLGPSLRGVPSRAVTRVAGLSAEDYITQSVLTPNAFVVPGFPRDLMPPTFGQTLTPQQIADVIAYLLTLQ